MGMMRPPMITESRWPKGDDVGTNRTHSNVAFNLTVDLCERKYLCALKSILYLPENNCRNKSNNIPVENLMYPIEVTLCMLLFSANTENSHHNPSNYDSSIV